MAGMIVRAMAAAGQALIRPKEGRETKDGDTIPQGGVIEALTAAQAVQTLRVVDGTDLSRMHDIFDVMLKRDMALPPVSHTRRLAFTGLPWEVIVAEEATQMDEADRAQAQEIVEWVRGRLQRIEGLDAALEHHALSIDRGPTVTEVEWGTDQDGEYGPIALHPVHPSLLTIDTQEPGRLRVKLGDNDYKGVPINERTPGKYIVHQRYQLGSSILHGGLLRLAVVGHLSKRLTERQWDWVLQNFGGPIVVAKYSATASDTEKKALKKMVSNLVGGGAAITECGTDLELLSGRLVSKGPHGERSKDLKEAYRLMWLGQTLTSDAGDRGTQALGTVHNEVREEYRNDDIRKESETFTRDLLTPMVLCVKGAGAFVPTFSRVVETEQDDEQVVRTFASAINDCGAVIRQSRLAERIGIAMEEGDGDDKDPILPGRKAGAAGLFDSLPQSVTPQQCPHCDAELIAHRHIDTIAARKGTAASKAAPWIMAVVAAAQLHTNSVLAKVDQTLGSSRDHDVAMRSLPAILDDLSVDDLVELERQFLLATNLAGRDYARQRIDAKERRAGKASHAPATELQAHAQGKIDFERLPFETAIEYFRQRLLLDPDAFEQLDAVARSRAWRVAGVYDIAFLAQIRGALAASMEAGETLHDFRRRLPEMAETWGWVGENPHHADIVHYQNFAMSHAAGRYGEYVDADVRYFQIAARGDSCPICESVIGKVFKIGDTLFFTPLHFWCDCEDVPLFAWEFEESGATDSASVDNPAFEDARARASGFRWDVKQYGNYESVQLDRFPAGFHDLIRGLARQHNWELN